MSLSSSRKKNLFMVVFGLEKKSQNRSESNWVYGFDSFLWAVLVVVDEF
jgi:hypothetical protein